MPAMLPAVCLTAVFLCGTGFGSKSPKSCVILILNLTQLPF